MKTYIYKVIIEEDQKDDRMAYHAYCPALKGCHTWGYSYEEALKNIKEAVELYIEDIKDAGKPIPEEGAIEILPEPAISIVA
ncbi:MAG: type II toxin-antitoxin system HicB family antitoxin [Nitrospirota bacterium]